MSPAISIIIRTVRRKERLRECLESIARQTFPQFEVVLVDMSAGLNNDLLKSFDFLGLLHLSSLLLARPVALNYGIRRARSEWIAILDDDNLWEPEFLATLSAEFAAADLFYTE